MPTYISPGTYTNIQDSSQYAAPASLTTCGIVGAATRGPVLGAYNASAKTYNTPVLITSPAQFISVFGNPSPQYQGPYAALLYLRKGAQLYYGRVVGTGAAVASYTIDSILVVSALNEGAWGNSIGITLQDSYVSGTKKITVYESVGGSYISREVYDGLSADPTSTAYYLTVINGASNYIQVAYASGQSGQPANTTSGSIIPLTGGVDGAAPADADIIGTVSDAVSTGLQAFADIDLIDVSMIAAPGYSSAAVVSAIATLTDTRQDCLGVLHGPQGLNAQEIVDWHNAAGSFASGGGTPSVRIVTNTCALYWPWVQIYDPYNSQNVWVPPTGFALQIVANTDNVGEPWYAPAGINRGSLFEALAVEYNSTRGQRDLMHGPGNGNAVNPIVNLPLDGITLYGQRTMQRTASSLDRINVRRLLFYMSKVLSRACRVLEFEQDDQLLWDQFNLLVAPFVQDIKNRRGVEQFAVVCDATTNTAFRRNNNELWGYVILIPTKTAEKVIVNFSLLPSGASLSIPQIG